MQKTTYEAKRAEKVVEEMRKMKTRPLITTKSPAKTPAALNTTFQKVQKLKKIDEKADQAKRAREDLLREKADSAKREREEREKRVEQNNRKKEEARLERENLNEKNIWRLLKNFKIKPHLLLKILLTKGLSQLRLKNSYLILLPSIN
ncbi:unnamed protein product [Meloidogyne enterolobii]|uniref:Uncharacterized protein n=1 Tax=Meloidogyne enterolobii TaxID=390850 RepID=A0ACB0Z6Q5_MELEN